MTSSPPLITELEQDARCSAGDAHAEGAARSTQAGRGLAVRAAGAAEAQRPHRALLPAEPPRGAGGVVPGHPGAARHVAPAEAAGSDGALPRQLRLRGPHCSHGDAAPDLGAVAPAGGGHRLHERAVPPDSLSPAESQGR